MIKYTLSLLLFTTGVPLVQAEQLHFNLQIGNGENSRTKVERLKTMMGPGRRISLDKEQGAITNHEKFKTISYENN